MNLDHYPPTTERRLATLHNFCMQRLEPGEIVTIPSVELIEILVLAATELRRRPKIGLNRRGHYRNGVKKV